MLETMFIFLIMFVNIRIIFLIKLLSQYSYIEILH